MPTLPTNRSPANTPFEHADDHNILHAQHNELLGHATDPTAAHAASAISFTPTGTVSATNVQAAIAEVASEGGGGGGGGTSGVTWGYLLANDIWYTSITSATPGVLTITAGSTWLFAVPFLVSESVAFNRIRLDPTSDLDSQFGHLGIYGPGTGSLKGQPGPRLFESGDLTITSAAPTLAVPGITLPVGLHWLAWKSMPTGVNYNVRSLGEGQSLGMPSQPPGTAGIVGWRISDTAANSALPDPFPTLDATHLVSDAPRILLGTELD